MRLAMQRTHWEGILKRSIQTMLYVFTSALLSTSLLAQQPAAQPSTVKPPTPTTPAAQPLLTDVNKQLPAWLRFSGEYRMRVEGFDGGGFKPDTRDAYVLSRVRLNMRVSPTYWMR